MVEFLTTDNVRNWRFRLTLAYQMSKVIELYTPQEVSKHHTTIGKKIHKPKKKKFKKNKKFKK